MLRQAATSPVPDTATIELIPARRRPRGSVIGHTGFNVVRYHTTHVFGALFPLLAGALAFGWRAIVCVLIVLSTTLLAGLVWRQIGARGHPLRPAQLLWIGLVMAMMLPASLLHRSPADSPWPILPAAGLMIVILLWALGGIGSGRFHPAVVVYLVLTPFYQMQLSPQTILQHQRLFTGDLLAAPQQAESRASQFPWRKRPLLPGQDAVRVTPPPESLLNFTHPKTVAVTSQVSLQVLLRDRVPPLEDLVLGATPGSIGTTSAVAVIVGGLFLLYRGLIDFRIPLLIVLAAWGALLVLPIHQRSQWLWFPGHLSGGNWVMGVTLANYEVLASPLLFTAFFLAGSPTVRPLGRKGRAVYAVMIGLLAAVFQMYVSVSIGSYLALLLVGMITPLLDRWFVSRPLV
jgi:Na+-translocating ferredoxin:NAD+ oxidoreductase RnfD subunit